LWANDANTAAAGGYALMSLKLRHRQSWAGGSVEPYVGIDNVQDKKVIGSVISNVTSPAGSYYEPALPRTWVLGLQAKWLL
jgi:outer membrane receptor protein involved in Fe transport